MFAAAAVSIIPGVADFVIPKPRVHIDDLNTGNKIVSDEASIANKLNKYFINILDQIGKDNGAG